MRKTNLKSRVKLSSVICLLVVGVFSAVFISSCQKDDYDFIENNKWDQEEYLDISVNARASNMADWSAADDEAFRKLHERITMGLDQNGLIYLEEQSAQEVNVSPRLYAIIREIVDNSNKFRLRKAAARNHIPLTKSDSNEDTESSQPSDCVAQAIYEALKQFGAIGLTAEDINQYLERLYGEGKGVPATKFVETVESYLKGTTMSKDNLPERYQREANDGTVYLVSANMVGWGGHAGIIDRIDDDWVYVKDNQNLPGSGGYVGIHKSELLDVFVATGVKN